MANAKKKAIVVIIIVSNKNCLMILLFELPKNFLIPTSLARLMAFAVDKLI